MFHLNGSFSWLEIDLKFFSVFVGIHNRNRFPLGISVSWWGLG